MNILIGSNVHWWNAEAAYAAVTARMLQEAGHCVYVLTRSGSENARRLREMGLTVITEPDLNSRNPVVLLRSYFQLRRFLQDRRIEIVNGHRSEGFPLFALARRSLDSFRLVRTRGASRQVVPHALNRKMHRDWMDAVIVPGEIIVKRDLKGIPISPERLHVIYYPVDLPPAFPIEVKRNYREEFNIPSGHRVLAVVGRIRPEKGHRLLLEAFQRFRKQFTEITLLILHRDTPSDHPEFRMVRKAVRDLGLESSVRFDSERDDIRELMAFADVGVISSIASEVICRVAVEFFSVGTPVTALPTGCLPEIVIEGHNGTLASRSSADSLCDALLRLFKDSEALKTMEIKARKDAETRFNPGLLLEKTMAVYQQVLES